MSDDAVGRRLHAHSRRHRGGASPLVDDGQVGCPVVDRYIVLEAIIPYIMCRVLETQSAPSVATPLERYAQ